MSSLFLTEQFSSRDYLQGAYMEYNGDDNFLTIGTQNANSDSPTAPRVEAIRIFRGSANVNFQGNVGIGTTNPSEKVRS